MDEKLNVTMLGGFSIRQGARWVDDGENRMKKVWLLLAYLIYTRNHSNARGGLAAAMNGDDFEEAENAAGRMKALFYRARALLSQLGTDLGHTLIVYKNGGYSWDPDYPITLDVEEFDRLCAMAAARTEPEEQLALYLRALELYRGDFLPKLASEPWVVPIAAYYHQLYLRVLEQTLKMLEDAGRWEEAEKRCQQGLGIEPYSEVLYQHKMSISIATGDRPAAMAAYEKMSELLFDNFGVMPSEESLQLYREACREKKDHAVSITHVQEQLRETPESKGAIFCEFDFFRFLYQTKARELERSGAVAHIALLSCVGQDGEPLSRRSLDTAVENLRVLMLENLRQGDVVTRCSVSQLCCMLPQANYENSCAVCQRIIKAFKRQYPHSPAQIQFRVHPLEPLVSNP